MRHIVTFILLALMGSFIGAVRDGDVATVRQMLAQGADPNAPEVQKIKADFIEGYNLNLATPYIAAERGYVDAVIEPHQTRLHLRSAMRLLRDKQIQRVQRKHGLIPI